jgi:NAD-dependent DNA ligase
MHLSRFFSGFFCSQKTDWQQNGSRFFLFFLLLPCASCLTAIFSLVHTASEGDHMEEMHFVYINAKGQVSAQSICNVSHSAEHVQGICNVIKQLRTFRKDRVIKLVETADAASTFLMTVKESDYSHIQLSKPKTQKVTFDVCFTGFKKADKDRLIECANANGMTVRSSVTQNLQLLCCGYNAGPTKVTAARMKGVVILDENQFADFVKTGEIPEV